MIDLAIIGAGPLATALHAHAAPLGRIRLTTADAHAMLFLSPPADRFPRVLSALRAGKIVLCPPPLAVTEAELSELEAAEASGGGHLLSAGEIVHSEAGRRGLAVLRAPEFGPLRSIYLAIRQPRGGAGDVLYALGWEALDFITAALPGGITQARINGGALFGPSRDTVVLLLRGPDDAVATVELSRCLPPTLPAPGLGEIEIDAIGAHQAVRIEPHASAVRIFNNTVAAAPWLDPPVLAMLRAIEHAADHGTIRGKAIAHARRCLAAMSAINSEKPSAAPRPAARPPTAPPD